MLPIEFSAPWGHKLKIVSSTATTILLLIAIVFVLAPAPPALKPMLAAVPLLAILIAVLRAVRGYALSEGELVIRRVGWNTHLSLTDLKSVEGKADAMRGAFRIVGNGGVYSFTGLFWNRQLRFFRAYATDRSRAVVLRFADRTVVITPHDPQQFIMRARSFLQTKDFPR